LEKNFSVVYKNGLQQNPKLAEQYNKINGRLKTVEQLRAKGDPDSLAQADKLVNQVASDAARLEKKLTEAGIVKDGIRYKPEPDLLGNNLHGLDWDGGPARLAKQDNPQGKFGSLQDIQFAVDKASELGPGGKDFFELPEGSSSVVYKYSESGEIITVPAKKVFVLVRDNGMVHSYRNPK
jgi:hypothetical protein